MMTTDLSSTILGVCCVKRPVLEYDVNTLFDKRVLCAIVNLRLYGLDAII